jgi:hypothetical protein
MTREIWQEEKYKGTFSSHKTEQTPEEIDRMDREIEHFQKTHAPGIGQRNE